MNNSHLDAAVSPNCGSFISQLNDPHLGEAGFASCGLFIAEVAHDPRQIRDDVERESYETKTRGARVQPAAHRSAIIAS